MFCLMFLIDAIKPNVEKKFKTVFLRYCLGGGSQESKNKTSFVSFRVRKTLFRRNEKTTCRVPTYSGCHKNSFSVLAII